MPQQRRRAVVVGGGGFGLLLCAIVLTAAAAGCKDTASPEYVADQFVEAYFRRVDQAGARQYTALGASEMLDKEIEATRSIRASGYTPEQAAGDVSVRRKTRTMRGERVRFDYDITIRGDGTEVKQSADIELASIQSAWKVVLLNLHAP
jgi:hypothetical protein